MKRSRQGLVVASESFAGDSVGGEAFAIGGIYINVTGVNPATELGYGTWSAFGAGRVLVGRDAGDADFDTAQETGGAKTKAISAHAGTAVADHASHTHTTNVTVDAHASHTHTTNVTVNDHAAHTHTFTQSSNATTPDLVTANTAAAGVAASGTTGNPSATLTHTVNNPASAGPNASLTHTVNNPASAGPSATLTHSVTQPSAHTDLNVMPPYIVAFFWLRTA